MSYSVKKRHYSSMIYSPGIFTLKKKTTKIKNWNKKCMKYVDYYPLLQ